MNPATSQVISNTSWGDPEKGFAEADIVVERDFVTGTVHQGYIEPHNATAHFNQDGQLTIWCSTQGAFTVREQVAEILQYPISKIKVGSDGDWRRFWR